MKENTWIAVMVALALMASMVIAKSFVTPGRPLAAQEPAARLAAQPQPAGHPAAAPVNAFAPPPPIRPVAQAAPPPPPQPIAMAPVEPPPRIPADEPPPAPAVSEANPEPEPAQKVQQDAQPEPTKQTQWTVLVVRGNKIERVTYESPDVVKTVP